MNTQNLSTLKINKLTQAQYNRELAAGRIDENALYLTPDDNYSNEDIDAILATKANSSHSHDISDVANLQTTLDELATKPDWNENDPESNSYIKNIGEVKSVNNAMSSDGLLIILSTEIKELISSESKSSKPF